jgi:hypothetical protein
MNKRFLKDSLQSTLDVGGMNQRMIPSNGWKLQG